MHDLEKILPFPRALINKGEMVKRLMASKDGGMSVMSAALHIVVKSLDTEEYLSRLVRGCSKYHLSTVPHNESQAWVLCVRMLLEVLLGMFQAFSVDEKEGLEVMLFGDNLTTSWSFLTGSEDLIVKNAILKPRNN